MKVSFIHFGRRVSYIVTEIWPWAQHLGLVAAWRCPDASVLLQPKFAVLFLWLRHLSLALVLWASAADLTSVLGLTPYAHSFICQLPAAATFHNR